MGAHLPSASPAPEVEISTRTDGKADMRLSQASRSLRAAARFLQKWTPMQIAARTAMAAAMATPAIWTVLLLNDSPRRLRTCITGMVVDADAR